MVPSIWLYFPDRVWSHFVSSSFLSHPFCQFFFSFCALTVLHALIAWLHSPRSAVAVVLPYFLFLFFRSLLVAADQQVLIFWRWVRCLFSALSFLHPVIYLLNLVRRRSLGPSALIAGFVTFLSSALFFFVFPFIESMRLDLPCLFPLLLPAVGSLIFLVFHPTLWSQRDPHAWFSWFSLGSADLCRPF